ncbi:hypothetical protein M6D81_02895 [Paenibacillus sp. J5C_2022]|uniref:hypothetical protein n=1 Tax=Paenibacillus sp. J5C2022 TaxID=2977129 RepID=UPI0021D09ED5|nr:hypothetical protein [Paenibacillus sp. J5C2022]MCU6707646.1 hypothetical protein [Paenibacillus sp. J5C2022]
MRRNRWKWIGFGVALAFLVIYGIELSTTGIERIHGPLAEGNGQYVQYEEEPPQSSRDRKLEDRIAELERELDDLKRGNRYPVDADSRWPGLYEPDEPVVNKLADSTSELLENASSSGIRFIASFFNGLFD